MRGGRSLLVLLVVALGLGAYIYFVESKRDPAGADAKEKAFSVVAADDHGFDDPVGIRRDVDAEDARATRGASGRTGVGAPPMRRPWTRF